jgi:hypothetical protein
LTDPDVAADNIVLEFETVNAASAAVSRLHRNIWRRPKDRLAVYLVYALCIIVPTILMLTHHISQLTLAAFLLGIALHRFLLGQLGRSILPFFSPDTVRILPKGPLIVTIGANGISSATDQSRVSFRWRDIPPAPVWPDGMMLRAGTMGFIPVPADKLPTGMTINQLGQMIQTWRRQDNG